ncbi:MAG: ABC transporter ATP-binding protein [Ferrovum sp. 37-45-19]|uniref:ATP-binding cassette domain-containing protein n=1 Tax=Ferrovum sp. JA12 TaxID=1356299 RepID=UPI0007031879|nr:ATP-binding cassette domain-containing protein [Ferrovum sp. JA12]OYV79936.1 MAG: ABC transporter ATP-binding protein [Ferrovum sp. 21-44-67]OYV95561.1 MAG: ABC transporter ATP-binding protein [Ferrovum sp. 37-45-19]OZB31600.1 MAG: ABC transporter ATP-binding protein [Ferrovum sp. 34-44-207]HQT81877.1 ATP-binding cassette domain-containing protein [Ferrovaceae bacterium]KRH78251.1 putative ABC transporter ATP-binding protein YbhF [Ferrovum sp. JA12]
MNSPLLFDRVSKTFPRGKDRIPALHQLSLSISAGKVTGLLGPDGSGKSTLIRIAAQLLLPDQGEVRLFGHNKKPNQDINSPATGYMPQRFGLYEELTVQENLTLYADLHGLTKEESLSRQKELLKLTALGPFSQRRAGALSGGMKQKLGLACTLLRTPALLLLDEPTVGVDPIARRELWNIIQELKKQQVTILMSTAYFDEAEQCDEVILLNAGQLLEKNSPHYLMKKLQGRTFLVNDSSPHFSLRQLQATIRSRPGIQDVRIVTEGVRVLCQPSIAIQFKDTERWQDIPPRFEDAFIDLLSSPHQAPTLHSSSTELVSEGGQSELGKPIIIVEHLSKRFNQFEAVKNVTFTVKKGEVFGLLGANGAGKTTTFRMLCGLLPATTGKLLIDGIDMRHASTKARARLGYVSQKFSLYGNLSCDQNLNFFAAAYGLTGQCKQTRIAWAIEEFQLQDYRQVNTDNLPLGIKQRLALSCALLHQPSILFLDEPTSGVDPLARREFWQHINLLASQGVTILITTHYMDEAEYCDHLVLMSLGEILAQGSPSEVRQLAVTPQSLHPSMEEAFITLIEDNEKQIRRSS